VPPAPRNFFAQIRQPNIGSITRNQILFLVLAGPPAFLARLAAVVVDQAVNDTKQMLLRDEDDQFLP
jgi:hypothetical protein